MHPIAWRLIFLLLILLTPVLNYSGSGGPFMLACGAWFYGWAIYSLYRLASNDSQKSVSTAPPNLVFLLNLELFLPGLAILLCHALICIGHILNGDHGSSTLFYGGGIVALACYFIGVFFVFFESDYSDSNYKPSRKALHFAFWFNILTFLVFPILLAMSTEIIPDHFHGKTRSGANSAATGFAILLGITLINSFPVLGSYFIICLTNTLHKRSCPK